MARVLRSVGTFFPTVATVVSHLYPDCIPFLPLFLICTSHVQRIHMSFSIAVIIVSLLFYRVLRCPNSFHRIWHICYWSLHPSILLITDLSFQVACNTLAMTSSHHPCLPSPSVSAEVSCYLSELTLTPYEEASSVRYALSQYFRIYPIQGDSLGVPSIPACSAEPETFGRVPWVRWHRKFGATPLPNTISCYWLKGVAKSRHFPHYCIP